VNAIWCLYLGFRNRSVGDFLGREAAQRSDWNGPVETPPNGNWLASNYFWAALAGVTWYCGFMLYGMGTTFMGRYDFTSWSIHLAFVIAFSTVCGILVGEWRGVRVATRWLVGSAMAVLVCSTMVIAAGNRTASAETAAAEPQAATDVAGLNSSTPSDD
jgi:L-rhamnose-H+ transport protein